MTTTCTEFLPAGLLRTLCATSFPNIDTAVTDLEDDIASAARTILQRILLSIIVPILFFVFIVLFLIAVYNYASILACVLAFLLIVFVFFISVAVLNNWLTAYVTQQRRRITADLVSAMRGTTTTAANIASFFSE
jgi:ABC-type transport system involved in cytochrome bd biosynthesis fused ATPase/permease subunit